MTSKSILSLIVNEIKLEANQLSFYFKNGNEDDKHIVNAGYKYVCDRFFKGDLPQDDEVEISIYYVEELVMGNDALMEQSGNLLWISEHLPEIFNKRVGDSISFEEVEELNHKYFDVIAGVPESVIQIDFTKEKFTVLMILRAIMHVLKIKQIEIG